MKFVFSLFIPIAFLFGACTDEQVNSPRPRGYFRIALPEKEFVVYNDSTSAYTAEIPEYSAMYRSSAPDAPATWRDLYFPEFKATLYISYHEITSDSLFAQLINQSWELTEAHHEMSSAMKDSTILRPDDRVFGTVIELGGSAASLVQFYLTDSTKNFIRGSLYFYAIPNADSLEPVLDYVMQDVYHFVETLKWTNPAATGTVKFPAPVPVYSEEQPPPALPEMNDVLGVRTQEGEN